MRIVADNKIPFLTGVFEPFAVVEYYQGKEITADIVKGADALIVRTSTKCDAYLLEGSGVKFIATATIGFDHIDTAYCKSKGIKWANAPGCNAGSVMQYIASALVNLSQKYNFSFSEKTIGIIGVGNAGSKVAGLSSILGLNVLLNDPPRERHEGKREFVSLHEIQEKSDIISFHVPLNLKGKDKTYHLFDNDFLEKIKPETILINSSRGGVLSNNVLKNALIKNKIKAAVIDVWENEPEIDQQLLEHVDIGTPHIAGYSADGKANATSMCVRALSNFFSLNVNNYFPDNILPAANKNFEINCKELTTEEIIKKLIISSYDIYKDGQLFQKSPQTFEDQRDNYPLRREFHAFKPKLINNNKNVIEIINLLGFK